MPAVLETFGDGPEGGMAYMQLSQLAVPDREVYAPHLADVQRAAWTQRYVEELGAATSDEIDRAFSDAAIAGRMADMTAPEGRTTYLTSEIVRPEVSSAAVIGFVRAARYTSSAAWKPAYPYVKDVNVHPTFARHGIGSMLLDRALAQFPEDRRVALYTHSANEAALNWYRLLGFFLRSDDVRPLVCLGTYEFEQLHLEAPSVAGVRAALLPSLVKWEYGPAVVDADKVSQNA